MHIQLPEDLRGIQKVLVLQNPIIHQSAMSLEDGRGEGLLGSILLCVPGEQRQIEDQRHPVAIDEEQERQEGVHGRFGDDVRVEAVAEVDRVDVVTGIPPALASTCPKHTHKRREDRESGSLEDQKPWLLIL